MPLPTQDITVEELPNGEGLRWSFTVKNTLPHNAKLVRVAITRLDMLWRVAMLELPEAQRLMTSVRTLVNSMEQGQNYWEMLNALSSIRTASNEIEANEALNVLLQLAQAERAEMQRRLEEAMR